MINKYLVFFFSLLSGSLCLFKVDMKTISGSTNLYKALTIVSLDERDGYVASCAFAYIRV